MKVSSRTKPAKIIAKPESELIQNNYLKIGSLTVDYPKEVCLGGFFLGA